jgi:hypothetical protein
MMMTRMLRATLACLLLLPNAVSAIQGVPGSTQHPSSYANVYQFDPSQMSFELSISLKTARRLVLSLIP